MLPMQSPCLIFHQCHKAAMQEVIASALSSLGNGDLERGSHLACSHLAGKWEVGYSDPILLVF